MGKWCSSCPMQSTGWLAHVEGLMEPECGSLPSPHAFPPKPSVAPPGHGPAAPPRCNPDATAWARAQSSRAQCLSSYARRAQRAHPGRRQPPQLLPAARIQDGNSLGIHHRDALRVRRELQGRGGAPAGAAGLAVVGGQARAGGGQAGSAGAGRAPLCAVRGGSKQAVRCASWRRAGACERLSLRRLRASVSPPLQLTPARLAPPGPAGRCRRPGPPASSLQRCAHKTMYVGGGEGLASECRRRPSTATALIGQCSHAMPSAAIVLRSSGRCELGRKRKRKRADHQKRGAGGGFS